MKLKINNKCDLIDIIRILVDSNYIINKVMKTSSFPDSYLIEFEESK